VLARKDDVSVRPYYVHRITPHRNPSAVPQPKMTQRHPEKGCENPASTLLKLSRNRLGIFELPPGQLLSGIIWVHSPLIDLDLRPIQIHQEPVDVSQPLHIWL
jgi:hypothetical protein